MRRFRFLLISLGILMPAILLSQIPEGFSKVDETEVVKTNIRETSAQTKSISSDFIQEKHLTMMEEVLVSNGNFLFKKPNSVKWEYVDPIKYAIIISDNRFIINNDGKISEYDSESNKLFKEISNMIVMAIQGDFVDNPDFQASFYEDNNTYLAVITPNDEMLKDILQTIEITFVKSDMAVSAVRFIEPGDDFTKITFKNREANSTISDDQFNAK